jgi:hypothetical protein
MPHAFFNAVEETVYETLRQGLYGWQVIDCLVTMTHTGYAPTSAAGDFRNLTPLVLMSALKQSSTKVYEPVHHFHLEIPADTLGRTLSSLAQLGAQHAILMPLFADGVLVGRIDAVRIRNEEFNQHIQKYLERTVWTQGCRSWYKNGTIDGPVIAVYGGTSFHFIEALKNPRWEDFHITREPGSNRYAYLGNGFTLTETRGESVGVTQTIDFDGFFDLFVLPNTHS